MKNKFTLLSLLLGILLLATSCEMQTNEEITEPTINISSEFNQEAFSKVIPYKFKVDWNNPVKGYSQELQAEFYEYNVLWLDNFNPDALEQNRKHLNIHTTYKLIAVLNKDKVQFYSVRMIEKNINKTPGLSLTTLNKFTGRVYFVNEQNDKIQISNYLEGKYKGDLTERTEDEHKLFLQSARMEEDCFTETTYHYTNWYNEYSDGTKDFMYSELTSITYETVCNSAYYDIGSTGGGSWPDGSESYEDCDDPVHGCFYEIENKLVKVIVDETVTANPTTDCIYGKLGPGNHAYDKFLAEFQNSTKYNVTFKLKDNLTDSKGQPANGFTDYTIGNNNVTIYINSSTLNRPSWEIAGTFVHEMGHAYLAQRLVSIGGPGNLKDYATNTNFTDLFDYYAKYVNPETGKYTSTQNSAAHHNLMADKLITDIAEGIRDYVESNTPDIKNYLEITLEHYKAVAWNGLRDTEAYTKLSDEAKDNIGKNTSMLQSFTVNDCQ